MIGQGSSSSVYKATDLETNQTFGLKLLHNHLCSDEIIVRRFEQGGKVSTTLRHPNIALVHACKRTEKGQPYLVIEYVDGTSLKSTIEAEGWLPEEQAIAMCMQVCAALLAAHEQGIVHRDLKPANIILSRTKDGMLVKVLDFGVAKLLSSGTDSVMKLTQTGEALGSLLYMSPEQCLDQELDCRSDCYSLGCVLYEALTGKPPLVALTAFETMNKQINDAPEELRRTRPDIAWSPALQAVVATMLQKKAEDRYSSIAELQDDLQALLEKREPSAESAPVKNQKKPQGDSGESIRLAAIRRLQSSID